MGAAMGKSLGVAFGLDVAINVGAWGVAALKKTEKFYDLIGSTSHLGVILFTLGAHAESAPSGINRAYVNSALACTWAIRLGTFLFRRISQDGRDVRFDKVRDRPMVFLTYWLIQAVWVFLTDLPVLMTNIRQGEQGNDIEARDYMGWMMWATGFTIQVLADAQKRKFRADPKNAGKWIDQGLWKYAQHPNYFGEMMMWSGLFTSSSAGFKSPWDYASIVSPLFVIFLLTRVSGIPLLRKAGQKRWGTNPDYQAYLRNTRLLVPLPK
mmetsp:Transcript_41529/g.90470  ORF Transcript_41529/g.90470 Transcript_41529/m.90470 type:complete len:267 (-) Transcript_41529:76-876(-)